MKNLVKYYKEYQKYLTYWNEQEEKKGEMPIPIGGAYQPSFTGFMDYLEKRLNRKI